ncbi:MAG TPA: helix-turn-helix domain-containing protein [Candidatus Eremiobacteraceae bacterium]|nr:helix-turn-helix domain-containing protein [Candidatus Eremiobacteraceae bacterium]
MFSKNALAANAVLRAVAATADPAAAGLCRRILLPLERADDERGSRLLDTLRAYYACGASVAKTAEHLFLHRNSVRYRLDRVRALLGADIDHPEVTAALLAAFAVAEAAPRAAESHEAKRAQ